MIVVLLLLAALLIVAGWRGLERWAYLKLGEEVEREFARRRD